MNERRFSTGSKDYDKRLSPPPKFNVAPPVIPQGRPIAGDLDPLAPHEVRHLKSINPTKTVQAVDSMYVADGPRGGVYVVLEAQGKLLVYRVASSERVRLGRQFRGPWWAYWREHFAAHWRAMVGGNK